uniref:Uncharacterized protein n=1 Tax=Wuchereria bancrofti TaxID=6293 RepID=A0A1I8E9Y6_WUCBA
MYLAAIEAFFLHPSTYLRNEVVAVFASLINHEKIGDDEIFNECICRVIISTPNLLEKVGYPSQNGHETFRFSQHDYDDDNDFSHEFTREINRCTAKNHGTYHFNYVIVVSEFRDCCLEVIRSCWTKKHVVLLISIVEKRSIYYFCCYFVFILKRYNFRSILNVPFMKQTEWDATFFETCFMGMSQWKTIESCTLFNFQFLCAPRLGLIVSNIEVSLN